MKIEIHTLRTLGVNAMNCGELDYDNLVGCLGPPSTKGR